MLLSMSNDAMRASGEKEVWRELRNEAEDIIRIIYRDQGWTILTAEVGAA